MKIRQTFSRAILFLVGGGALTGAVSSISCGSDGPTATVPPDANTPAVLGDASFADSAVRLPLPTGRFRIGMWCGLPGGQMTQARVDEAASAGFTTMSYGCEGVTYDLAYNTAMLSYAKKDDMDAIIYDQRIVLATQGKDIDTNLDGVVKDFSTMPGFGGYYVEDEPTAPFTNVIPVMAGLQKRDANHFAYVNLLPSYASAGQLGTASYNDYIASFLAAAKPRVISYDHYPFYADGSESSSFYVDLSTMRTNAVAANIPFWQFTQSISFSGHRATTATEKLWQGMQTLVYGGAGIFYFTYWTPPQTAESFGSGIIDATGNETTQYAEVKTINARLQAFGRYLVAAKSTITFQNGALPAGTITRVPGAPVYFPNAIPLVVGLFSTVNNDQYAFITNRDIFHPIESDVFVASAAPPEVLDAATGAFVPATVLAIDPARGFKIHISLPNAEGTLLHLVGPVPPGALGAEAIVATVRNNGAGMMDVLDSAYGDSALRVGGWNECPDGYTFAGRFFDANGFWLCKRNDLLTHTFYVGNVIADQAILYSVASGVATPLGSQGWDTCPKGKLLGRRFESNGYWACME